MPDLPNQAMEYLRSQADGRKFYGLYRGKIEDIDDPDRACRVKVRVWAVHGDKTRYPKTALPWADVPDEGGGGYDFGSFDPYIIGCSVWLGFEMGDPEIPVILGGFRGEPLRDDDNPNIFLVDDKEPSSESPWLPPDGELEIPKDVFDELSAGDPHPTRRVWKKSYKGHTIVVDDGDGLESFKIIDRSGQVLEFDCAVREDIGKGNAAQRDTRDATRGDQMAHAAMVDRYAHIKLMDLSGQMLLLNAQDRQEEVILRSRNRQGSIQSHLKLMSGSNNKGIELKDSGGNFLRFDPDSNEPIRIQDMAGNAIVFDKDVGTIKMVCSKTATAEIPQQVLTILGKKDLDVRGDEIKRILGNKKTTVSNDATGGVMGNVNYTLGGALKISVVNAAPSGSEANAIDISIGNPVANTNPTSLGSHTFKLSNQWGDMTIDTIKGDVELLTLLGDAKLTTLSGNVECSTVAGNVELTTLAGSVDVDNLLGGLSVNPAGISNLYGSLVRLGSSALAIQPLVKGAVLGAYYIAYKPLLAALALAGTAAAGASGTPTPVTNAALITALGTAINAFAIGLGAAQLISTPLLYSTKVFTE